MSTKTAPQMDIHNVLGTDRSSGHGRRRKLWIVVVCLAVAVLLLVVMRLSAKKDGQTQYKTQEVTRGNLTVLVTATGTLQPTNTVSVGSELSGILKTVEANYNDHVKVGQVLARLDTQKLEAQLIQSKAALESAKAKVLQTQATVVETRAKLLQLQKVRELSKNRVPSQSDIDAAQAAFDRAKADAASAGAAVTQAQGTHQANALDLSKAVIRSPINGIVLTRSIEPGQTVAASYQAPVLFTLAEDLAHMQLHVNIDEADVGKVNKGQKAAFSVSAYPHRTFEGEITQVRYGSSTTSGVVTYETVLSVNNANMLLRPGMTATADIIVSQLEKVILIPAVALRFSPSVQQNDAAGDGGSLMEKILPHPPSSSSNQQNGEDQSKKQQTVWTLRDGKLAAITITTGATNGIMTQVTAGDIQTGMKLVIDTEIKGK
jgi:HlyD family secretion protein